MPNPSFIHFALLAPKGLNWVGARLLILLAHLLAYQQAGLDHILVKALDLVTAIVLGWRSAVAGFPCKRGKSFSNNFESWFLFASFLIFL
jgi:hypothetical protein